MSQCAAKSKRSQTQCLKWAVRGKRICHMHGARSKGPKTPEGKKRSRLAAFKHGGCTQESMRQTKEANALIRKCKNTLRTYASQLKECDRDVFPL